MKFIVPFESSDCGGGGCPVRQENDAKKEGMISALVSLEYWWQ